MTPPPAAAAPDPGPARWPVRMVNEGLCLCGLLLIAAALYCRRAQQHERIITALVAALAMAPPYFLAAWVAARARAARSTLALVVGFALVLRVVALSSPNYLSTDLYRYIWDGRVQAAGINPYRYVPVDPALAPLRDEAIYPKINRREYARTIYPPLAEAFFYLVTRASESPLAMRLAAVCCEGLVGWGLWRLLRAAGRPSPWLLAYAWHPLPVWEFAGSGHVDALMMACLVGACCARRADRPGLTGLALGGAILVKLYPVLLLPACYRRGDWRLPAALAATLALAYLPYLATTGPPPAQVSALDRDLLPPAPPPPPAPASASVPAGSGGSPATAAPAPASAPALSPTWWRFRMVMGFLPIYTHEEQIDSGKRFYLQHFVPAAVLRWTRLGPTPFFTLLALAVLGGLAAAALWRCAPPTASPDRSVGWGFALAAAFTVLLSPEFPWYFAWLVPFLCLRWSTAVGWITAGSFALYANWIYGSDREEFHEQTLVYLPALLFLLGALWWRRWARSPRGRRAAAP